MQSLAHECQDNMLYPMKRAILVRNQSGDFYGSLFIVNGVYGLEMYIAGIFFVLLFRKFSKDTEE